MGAEAEHVTLSCEADSRLRFPSSCDSMWRGCQEAASVRWSVLEEPVQVRSVTRAPRRMIADAGLTGFESSKGWQRVASQLTDPKHTLAGVGVRREKRASVWNVKKREKTRGGASYEVMQNRGARASDAAPISRRRCVCFAQRNTRQPNNAASQESSPFLPLSHPTNNQHLIGS